MDWYLTVLRSFSDFSGRARRKEYWMFTLFNAIFAAVASVLDRVLGLAGEAGIGPLYGLYLLVVLVPGIAVAIRRMHDTGRSGWMLLVGLIPLIGVLLVLYWAIQEGEPRENAYGPDPKEDPSYVLS